LAKKSKTPPAPKKKATSRTAARVFEELAKIRKGQRRLERRYSKLESQLVTKPKRETNALHDALGLDGEDE
jgi:hypothetical protein